MGCYTQTEVQQFIQENDVRFVRLAFCDILGNQKNISILADEIPRAFEHGISFDASAVAGFTDICNSDLLLFPDASTITILPWRPMDGRVARMFCNIKHPDGRAFERDSRTLLREKMLEAFSEGYDIKIGAESEFYLFKMNEDGEATEEPIDSGSYFDITPKDKGENIRREICLTLSEMGIKPVSSHHERGPGQNEIVFRYSDALRSADNFTSYKVVVRTMAARDGLVASFLPKPLAGEIGSGLHINMSLYRNDSNIFSEDESDIPSGEIEHFIAGVMAHISDITVFLNRTDNSYERLGGPEAPKYISWSRQNRSQLIRIPAASGDYRRFELRSPDAGANPYLAFAMIIAAGLDGIKKKLPLSEPVNEDLSGTDKVSAMLKSLPTTLDDAVNAAIHSRFVRETLEAETLDKYIESVLADRDSVE